MGIHWDRWWSGKEHQAQIKHVYFLNVLHCLWLEALYSYRNLAIESYACRGFAFSPLSNDEEAAAKSPQVILSRDQISCDRGHEFTGSYAMSRRLSLVQPLHELDLHWTLSLPQLFLQIVILEVVPPNLGPPRSCTGTCGWRNLWHEQASR